MAAKIPQGRLGTAEDVAKGILFPWASDDFQLYNRNCELSIDGGYMVTGIVLNRR